jgi:hypothetical protein
MHSNVQDALKNDKPAQQCSINEQDMYKVSEVAHFQ